MFWSDWRGTRFVEKYYCLPVAGAGPISFKINFWTIDLCQSLYFRLFSWFRIYHQQWHLVQRSCISLQITSMTPKNSNICIIYGQLCWWFFHALEQFLFTNCCTTLIQQIHFRLRLIRRRHVFALLCPLKSQTYNGNPMCFLKLFDYFFAKLLVAILEYACRMNILFALLVPNITIASIIRKLLAVNMLTEHWQTYSIVHIPVVYYV
jgi:hypothetical protein